MRRDCLRICVCVMLLLPLLSGSVPAIAQDATPASAPTSLLAELGLPELTVTITDEGFEIAPVEAPAGRYLVNVINNTSEPEAIAIFGRLPEDMTLDDVSFADEIAAGTPIPEVGPSPEELAWLYETYMPGGTGATAAEPGQVVLDLKGGEYAIGLFTMIPPAMLTVTGDPDAAITGPEPDAAVTIVGEGVAGEEYHFSVSGELGAGRQVVKVLNASDQIHEVIALQYPEPLTDEQLMSWLTFDPSTGATPPPDAIDDALLAPVSYAAIQSIGTTQWVETRLAPGQVMLFCFVPDPLAGGLPHSLEGMVSLLPVAEP